MVLIDVKTLAVGILMGAIISNASDEVEWTYEGKTGFEEWPSIKAAGYVCGGRQQSPIDITAHLSQYRPTPKLQFYGYKTEVTNVTAAIIHESANIVNVQNRGRYITGGPLKGRYNVFGFHFHWGRRSGAGSEHTFDGKRFPLELHIVHVKDGYRTIEEAREHPDGICVLAVLFEIGEPGKLATRSSHVATWRQDEAEKRLTDYFTTLSGREKLSIWRSSFRLSDLLPLYPQMFYSYNGSLTTPPCSEAVTWIVFRHRVPISNNLHNRLQGLKNSKGIPPERNWRQTQPINGRVIYRNFEDNKVKRGKTRRSHFHRNAGRRRKY